jgi:hypothetical protein
MTAAICQGYTRDVITDVFGWKCPSRRPFRLDVRERRLDVRPHPHLSADVHMRPRGRTPMSAPSIPCCPRVRTDATKIKIKNKLFFYFYFFLVVVASLEREKKFSIFNFQFSVFGFQSPKSPNSPSSSSSASFAGESTRRRRFFRPSTPSHPSKLYSSLGWLNSKVPKPFSPFSLRLIDVDGF